MIVLKARNVNNAWAAATQIVARGPGMARQESRAGPVLVADGPVVTSYERSQERVLLDPVRDANPFFHLMEALWMLAGRDDAAWLDQFVSDYSARFAEPSGRQHGAYGKRWRDWHRIRDGAWSHPNRIDQLDEVVRLLRANSDDRQAVLGMWDPSADLGVPGLRDRPCNTHAYLRVRREAVEDPSVLAWEVEPATTKPRTQLVLDLTVLCRSNDAIWGAYGANAVHMSVLQEYLAARIGVGVGTYYQFSNNWHVYEATLGRCDVESARTSARRPYPGYLPLVDDPDSFDAELRQWISAPNELATSYTNSFLQGTASPMWWASHEYRERNYDGARGWAEAVKSPDWRTAATEWLDRRRVAREKRIQ